MAVIRGNRVDDEAGGVTVTWANVTTSDTADATSIGDLIDVVVQNISGGAGTAQMQLSNNNSDWINNGAALAANTVTAVSPLTKFIRFNPIAAATVTLVLFGRKRKY